MNIGLNRHLNLTPAQLADRLFQHMGVEFVADRGHATGLFLAQEIARPANLQIVGRQTKPPAQVVQLLEDLQAPLSVPSQGVFPRNEQIGIGAHGRPSDPSA